MSWLWGSGRRTRMWSAVDGTGAGLDRADVHVDGACVRARLEVKERVRGGALVRRVNAQLGGRADGMASRGLAEHHVVVLQHGVGGSARREDHGVRGPGAPAGGAAELTPGAVDRRDPGKAVQRARVGAEVGELKR